METAHVTIKIETFNDKGVRNNVECFSLPYKSFLAQDLVGSEEFWVNLTQAIHRAQKEITNPTPKKDMA